MDDWKTVYDLFIYRDQDYLRRKFIPCWGNGSFGMPFYAGSAGAAFGGIFSVLFPRTWARFRLAIPMTNLWFGSYFMILFRLLRIGTGWGLVDWVKEVWFTKSCKSLNLVNQKYYEKKSSIFKMRKWRPSISTLPI